MCFSMVLDVTGLLKEVYGRPSVCIENHIRFNYKTRLDYLICETLESIIQLGIK